ncbi:MAG: hypothetical protein LUH42_04245 [Oscillospiraceae bacterium]|nr:hypothetical protein [Oscillospiraceae bacterium]
MKTLLINASPKKRGGASSYFLSLARFFISGDKETERLRGKGDYQRILQKLPALTR